MHDEALSGGSWHLNSYLLLDGISVEALPRKIYEWSDSPEYEVLYLETPWVELSPPYYYLVRSTRQSPAFGVIWGEATLKRVRLECWATGLGC